MRAPAFFSATVYLFMWFLLCERRRGRNSFNPFLYSFHNYEYMLLFVGVFYFFLFGSVGLFIFCSSQRFVIVFGSPLVSTTRWFVLYECVCVCVFLSFFHNRRKNEAPQGIYFYSFRAWCVCVCGARLDCVSYLDCERLYIYIICECPQFIFINFGASTNLHLFLAASSYYPNFSMCERPISIERIECVRARASTKM